LSASVTEGVEGARGEYDEENNEDDEDEYKDDEGVGSDMNSSSTSPGPQRPSVQYRALLERARQHHLGEKRFKRALIQHAASHLDELIHSGATDNQRAKAVKEALVDLNRYVSNVILLCCFVADVLRAPVLVYGRNVWDYGGWPCHRLIRITPQVFKGPACLWAHNGGYQHDGGSP
jgi:hypothetical protein